MHLFRIAHRFFRFVSSLFRYASYHQTFSSPHFHSVKPRWRIFVLFSLMARLSITATFLERQMSWDPVYKLVQRIPRGRVLTYGALAKALRLPGGARTAGRAMAGTPSGQGIPWHRIVGERGKILIRGPYAMLQKKLLESEGVKLIESRVDLKLHAWKPATKTAATGKHTSKARKGPARRRSKS
jgi:methylated-DNA-protein-cysteine methyltransferase related protein